MAYRSRFDSLSLGERAGERVLAHDPSLEAMWKSLTPTLSPREREPAEPVIFR